MYAIMHLPDALWVRDLRKDGQPNWDDIALFETEEAAEEYIQNIVLPYTRGMFHTVIREYLQIFPVEVTNA
jgi:hypothetical protein